MSFRKSALWGLVPTLLGLAIAAAALYVLSDSFKSIRYEEIAQAASTLSRGSIFLALLCTLVSFSALGFYDVLAAEIVVPGRVSPVVAGIAGAAAYAVSNLLGFPIVTGGAVRFLVYRAQGLASVDIARIVGSTWMALWFAILMVLGLALVFDPEGITLLDSVSDFTEQFAGLVFLLGLAVFFTWLSLGARSVKLWSFEMPLPDGKMALSQLVIGFIDLCAAGLCLYVLLPADTDFTIGGYAVVYALAVVLTVISHAPGGLGVFEATIVSGLGLEGRVDVLASLVIYRIIYYALPFFLTVLSLTGAEALRHRRRLNAFGKRFIQVLDPLIPPTAAILTFFAGVVLLVSGVTPAEHDRLHKLLYFVSLPFMETSHFLNSISGVCLLVLARGLMWRRERAWFFTMAFLGAGALFSLLKGLDYEEAIVSLIIAGILWVFRGSFYRRPAGRYGYITPGWMAVVLFTVGAAIALGMISYQDVTYQDNLWWKFALSSDAPRFLRGAVGMLVVLVMVGIDMLVNRRFAPVEAIYAIPPVVEELVARSPISEHHLALLGDKQFLVSDDHKAFLMYGVSGHSFISMGDPVGDAASGQKLIWQFCEMADKNAGRAVFYCARPEKLPFYLDLGFSLLKIGEAARVDLTGFTLEGKAGYDNRYAVKRAQKDGLTFAVIPKADVPRILDQLLDVSNQWLAEKQGSEKGFSLGFFSEDNLKRFDCAVMKRGEEIVAFANLWRGAELEEASIDLMRYKPNVSKVIMDALFVNIMLHMKDEGFRWFNLGSAPLSGLTNHPLASSWNKLGNILFRRGGAFYSFEGIRAFKSKYHPVWMPLYIACPGGLMLPQVLMDLSSLISGSGRAER
jgi:phosphatidylglycerol lysyltransferase